MAKTNIKSKKKSSLVFLIVILFAFLFIKINLTNIFLFFVEIGIQNKNYDFALKNIEFLEKYNPDNEEYNYYKVQILSKKKLTLENQEELFNLASRLKPFKGQDIAIYRLQIFQNQIHKHFGQNYIKDTLYNNEVMRWNPGTFPLKYYIEKRTDIPPYYIQITKNSFKEWEKKSKNFIRFQEVLSPQKADITIKFVDFAQNQYSMRKITEYSVGNTIPKIQNGILQNMNILILTTNSNKKPFSHEEMNIILLHEIGHAIGLWGHTHNSENIMYYSADKNPYFEQSITIEDINTLKLLYRLNPTITNKPVAKKELQNLITPKLVTESIDNYHSNKIDSALNFLQKNPKDTNRWIELAEAYAVNGQYHFAINCLNKANSLSYTRETKHIIFYNTAINLIFLKNYDDALIFATYAKNMKEDIAINILITEILIKQNRFKEAEKMLLTLSSENPQNITISLRLANFYIKQKSYLKARKTLKTLLKNNPSAKEDKMVKYYRFYTIF